MSTAPSTDAPEIAELDRIVEERRKSQGIDKASFETKRISDTLAEISARWAEPNPERDAKIAEHEERIKRERILADKHQSWSAVLSGAGTEYAKCTLDNYRLDGVPGEFIASQRAAHTAVVEYAREISARVRDCVGLVLFGPVGTGKDHLAISVCRKAIAAELRCGWINCQRWFASIRDAIDTNVSESRILAEVTWPHLLVISDPLPNAGELTAYQSTWLYRVADSRRAAGKPTIVTINVSNDSEADSRLGEATWDRLCHNVWKIHCKWPSYRKPLKTINCK